jgi:hypothetical protein
MKRLLSSSPQKLLTYQALSEIRTELGLIRLKVTWSKSRQAAVAAQHAEERRTAIERAEQKRQNERRLQRRMAVVLGIYVILLVLIIAVVPTYFSTAGEVPTSQDPNASIRDEILWLFAFVGGFSDRFFEVVLDRVRLVAGRDELNQSSVRRVIAEINDEIQHEESAVVSPVSDPTGNGSVAALVRYEERPAVKRQPQ